MTTDDLLLQYLAEHDAVCPRCRYTLTGAATSTCPECGIGLSLTLRGPVEHWGWWVGGLCAWLPVSGLAFLYVIPVLLSGGRFTSPILLIGMISVLGTGVWLGAGRWLRRAGTRTRVTLTLLSIALSAASYSAFFWL